MKEGKCIMGEMKKDRENLTWKEKYEKERAKVDPKLLLKEFEEDGQ